jgi:hypothetical protein
VSVNISIGHGLNALIDESDLALVGPFKWLAMTGDGGKRYAARWDRDSMLLHRFITGAVRGQDVDHINGDTLDNRRANLRVCSRSDNLGNQKLRGNNTSGFKGVYWNVAAGKWRAKIADVYLGLYPTAEDAARAYDDGARMRWGEFARLNFPLLGERSCRDTHDPRALDTLRQIKALAASLPEEGDQ